MWMKDAYLMWLAEMLPGSLKGSNEEIDKADDDGEDKTTSDVAVRSESTAFYQVAKTPTFWNLSVEQLALQFGAEDFVLALSVYL